MPSLGAAHLFLGLVIVGLVYDSRRLRALARLTGRTRHDPGGPALPDGNLDRVGLPLRLVQMRINVDWADGGAAWEGPEVLPDEGLEDEPAPRSDLSLFGEDDVPSIAEHAAGPGVGSLLPVLWKPFPALLPGSGADEHPPDTPTSLLVA